MLHEAGAGAESLRRSRRDPRTAGDFVVQTGNTCCRWSSLQTPTRIGGQGPWAPRSMSPRPRTSPRSSRWFWQWEFHEPRSRRTDHARPGPADPVSVGGTDFLGLEDIVTAAVPREVTYRLCLLAVSPTARKATPVWKDTLRSPAAQRHPNAGHPMRAIPVSSPLARYPALGTWPRKCALVLASLGLRATRDLDLTRRKLLAAGGPEPEGSQNEGTLPGQVPGRVSRVQWAGDGIALIGWPALGCRCAAGLLECLLHTGWLPGRRRNR